MESLKFKISWEQHKKNVERKMYSWYDNTLIISSDWDVLKENHQKFLDCIDFKIKEKYSE